MVNRRRERRGNGWLLSYCSSASDEARIEDTPSERAPERGFPQTAPRRRFTVAKIFDLQSFINGKRGQPSSKADPNSSDSGQMGGNHVQPISRVQRASEDHWPGSTSRTSINAGAGLLLVIGVLCGLYLGGKDRKSAVANPKSDKQLQPRATAQPSSPTQSLSKPSPAIPANTTGAETSMVSKLAPATVPSLPASSVPRYAPIRFEATHKKVFGGCTGQLELSRARLHFSCPNQADLNFPVDAIAGAHKDGVVLKSGEKYHFVIANHTKDQVKSIFISWLNQVQQFPQPSRVSSF